MKYKNYKYLSINILLILSLLILNLLFKSQFSPLFKNIENIRKNILWFNENLIIIEMVMVISLLFYKKNVKILIIAVIITLILNVFWIIGMKNDKHLNIEKKSSNDLVNLVETSNSEMGLLPLYVNLLHEYKGYNLYISNYIIEKYYIEIKSIMNWSLIQKVIISDNKFDTNISKIEKEIKRKFLIKSNGIYSNIILLNKSNSMNVRIIESQNNLIIGPEEILNI